MRLWHWKLIPALPRQQLLGQWRECCAIAKSIHDQGTPNHILVNPILDYPIEEFLAYSNLVAKEMNNRGYHADIMSFKNKLCDNTPLSWKSYIVSDLFLDWHDDQYLKQCYYNLQEKHDRGGITDEEWKKIQEVVDYGISP